MSVSSYLDVALEAWHPKTKARTVTQNCSAIEDFGEFESIFAHWYRVDSEQGTNRIAMITNSLAVFIANYKVFFYLWVFTLIEGGTTGGVRGR